MIAERGNEMTQNMLAIERLQELPLSERREGLEELVVTEFKTTLMMTDDEDLPFDMSYFELGFTSLRITEIKERLETQLGRVAVEQRRAVEWRKQPFVRVNDHGVGLLDAVEEPAHRGREQAGAAVSRVDVKPQSLLPGYFGHPGQ